jgi:hypothetical protein
VRVTFNLFRKMSIVFVDECYTKAMRNKRNKKTNKTNKIILKEKIKPVLVSIMSSVNHDDLSSRSLTKVVPAFKKEDKNRPSPARHDKLTERDQIVITKNEK